MAILLWDPEGSGDSFYGELVELRRDIQKYRAAILPDEVQQLVHAAAMNPEVSGEVIAKVKRELLESHNNYLCLLVKAAVLVSISMVLAIMVELLQIFIHDDPWLLTTIAWMLLVLAVEFYYLRYFEWRANYSDSYIAHFLIRAMEFGLKYQEDPSNQYLRDGLARLIQQVAIRYTLIYKRSNGTRFFVKQVREQAVKCRGNIISLVPGLVTASRNEIETLNYDLARLLIRTQTGYWHQTDDIARRNIVIRRSDVVRISIASFFRDRVVQVALIGLTATIIAGLIAHS